MEGQAQDTLDTGIVTLSPEELDAFADGKAPQEPAEEPAKQDTSGESAKVETKTASESETEPAQEQAAGKEPEKKEPENVPAGVQKRIDKAISAQKDAEYRAGQLERELAALRGGKDATKEAKPPEKPKPDNYETTEQYLEALAEYKADQRLEAKLAEMRQKAEESRQQAANQQITARADEVLKSGQAAHADFDEVAGDLDMSDAMTQFVLESEHGHEVLYQLGQSKDEHGRIVKLSPLQQIRELTRIETKIIDAKSTPKTPSVPELPKPPVSASPEPMTPLTPSGGAAVPEEIVDGKLNPAWERYWEKRREGR